MESDSVDAEPSEQRAAEDHNGAQQAAEVDDEQKPDIVNDDFGKEAGARRPLEGARRGPPSAASKAASAVIGVLLLMVALAAAAAPARLACHYVVEAEITSHAVITFNSSVGGMGQRTR